MRFLGDKKTPIAKRPSSAVGRAKKPKGEKVTFTISCQTHPPMKTEFLGLMVNAVCTVGAKRIFKTAQNNLFGVAPPTKKPTSYIYINGVTATCLACHNFSNVFCPICDIPICHTSGNDFYCPECGHERDNCQIGGLKIGTVTSQDTPRPRSNSTALAPISSSSMITKK